MKSKIIFTLAIFSVLVLSACSFGKSEQMKAAEGYLDASLKRDNEKAESYLSKELKGAIDDSVGNELLENDLESEEAKEFYDNLIAISNESSFKIEETESKNIVKATVTFIDISEPVSEVIQDAIGDAFLAAFSQEQPTEEEMEEKMLKDLNMRLAAFEKEPTTVTGSIELTEENGKVVISSIDENIENAIMLGLVKLNESLESL